MERVSPGDAVVNGVLPAPLETSEIRPERLPDLSDLQVSASLPRILLADSEDLGRANILLVDRTEINRQLLKGILKAGPYKIIEARDTQSAFDLLAKEPVDLIIADVTPAGVDGLEFCRRLKADRATRLVPILIIASVHGFDNEVAYLDSGADEFLTRPLQPAIVRTRVKTMLRNKRVVDSLEEAETILFALAVTVEHRDKETGNHCQRLAALSVSLGKALGLPNDDLLALYRGGFLHDIGKIAVPDSILFKKGMLNEEEWAVMRSHTWKGERICSPMRSLKPVLPIIRNHHERWDGTGYPDGMAGEAIPLLARILQLADIYDALTSRRSYKSAYTPEEAVAMLEREAEMGWRDAELVSVFCQMVRDPSFVTQSAALFAAVEDETENAALQSMLESLARMSRELLK